MALKIGWGGLTIVERAVVASGELLGDCVCLELHWFWLCRRTLSKDFVEVANGVSFVFVARCPVRSVQGCCRVHSDLLEIYLLLQ